MSFDHPWVRRAKAIAQVAHRDQTRKDGRTPYFSHLEAVAEILATHGHDDPATLAAAFLHDLLEDQPTHAAVAMREMPPAVMSIVAALTETKTTADGKTRTKADRFHDYVTRLADGSEASRAALPVSCADKIHNTRSLVEAEARGERLLNRLNTRPEEHEPHLATLRALYAPEVQPGLLSAFDLARDALLHVLERRRSLQLRLDDASRATVRELARYPIRRGDHVTLAHGVDPARFEPSWVPGGGAVGDRLPIAVEAEHTDARLQVLSVRIAGRGTRPFDGGPLHVTVSRVEQARSREANALLRNGPAQRTPCPLTLTGTVDWARA